MSGLIRISRKTLVKNQWIALHEDVTDRHGKPGKYFVVDRADTVIMAVVDLKDQLLFVEQFRYPTEQLSLELPMGGIDAAELPVAAATRELHEETGIVIEDVHELSSFRPVPGLSPQKAHVLFCRYDGNFTDVEGLSTEGQIEDDITGNKVVPMGEIAQMILTGIVTDGFTLSALMVLTAANKIRLSL